MVSVFLWKEILPITTFAFCFSLEIFLQNVVARVRMSNKENLHTNYIKMRNIWGDRTAAVHKCQVQEYSVMIESYHQLAAKNLVSTLLLYSYPHFPVEKKSAFAPLL